MNKPILVGALMQAICLSVIAQDLKEVGYHEATSFERSLLSRDLPNTEKPNAIFTQPLNKKEPCKLQTSLDQLSRNNFRAYWDGACKNGYAFGLGRDIAISDTHHIEEITIHDGTGENYKGKPGVTYDFVANQVYYWVQGENHLERISVQESFSNNLTGFFYGYRQIRVDSNGHMFMVESSPFSSHRAHYESTPRISYKYYENTLAPYLDYSVTTYAVETIDPKDGKTGGVAFVRFGKDLVRYFQINGSQRVPVNVTDVFLFDINRRYENILSEVGKVNIDAARKIEQEYLYFACNGKYKLEKLDKETSTKICNWRDQFKEPYEKALAKYRQEVEQIKLKASADLQRKEAQEVADQQRVAQQRQLEAQRESQSREQTRQGLEGVVNFLSQFGQGM